MKGYKFFALLLALALILSACGKTQTNPVEPPEDLTTPSASPETSEPPASPEPTDKPEESAEPSAPVENGGEDEPAQTPGASEPPKESEPPEESAEPTPENTPENTPAIDPAVLPSADGIYFEPGKTVSADSVTLLADKMKSLKDSYFADNSVYYAIIPDKSYLGQKSGAAYYDHGAVCSQLAKELSGFTEINIAKNLSLSDYYITDPHWRQEKLTGVAAAIGKAMGVEISASGFTENALEGFIGTYSQLTDALSPETLYYLTGSYINSAKVTNLQKPDFKGVYDTALFDTNGYDIFLSGATPLTVITNPLCDSGKELVIFRDSFGSSIAPLLLEPYSKVTLVDLRYMVSDLIPKYVKFENADVLFLYCDELVGSSYLLK